MARSLFLWEKRRIPKMLDEGEKIIEPFSELGLIPPHPLIKEI